MGNEHQWSHQYYHDNIVDRDVAIESTANMPGHFPRSSLPRRIDSQEPKSTQQPHRLYYVDDEDVIPSEKAKIFLSSSPRRRQKPRESLRRRSLSESDNETMRLAEMHKEAEFLVDMKRILRLAGASQEATAKLAAASRAKQLKKEELYFRIERGDASHLRIRKILDQPLFPASHLASQECFACGAAYRDTLIDGDGSQLSQKHDIPGHNSSRPNIPLAPPQPLAPNNAAYAYPVIVRSNTETTWTPDAATMPRPGAPTQKEGILTEKHERNHERPESRERVRSERRLE